MKYLLSIVIVTFIAGGVTADQPEVKADSNKNADEQSSGNDKKTSDFEQSLQKMSPQSAYIMDLISILNKDQMKVKYIMKGRQNIMH